MRARSVTASVAAAAISDALGAPADGARDVRERGRARAAGQDELLERRELGVEALDVRLEARDVRVADRRGAGDRQLAAQVEQVVLDGESGTRRRPPAAASASSTPIVELSSSTAPIAVDARRILGHARAVAQAGGAGVAGARHDASRVDDPSGAPRFVVVRDGASVTKSAEGGKPSACRRIDLLRCAQRPTPSAGGPP